MPTTSRLDLPYPTDDDANDVAGDLLALVTKLDSDAAADGQGLLSARPSAGVRGRYYWATDTEKLYRDDGSAWHDAGSTKWESWTTGYITDTGYTVTPVPTAHSRAHYQLDGTRCTVQWSEQLTISGATGSSIYFRVKLPFAPKYQFNTFPAVVQATRPVGLSVADTGGWYVDLRKPPNSTSDAPTINNETSWWYFAGVYEIA